MTGFQGMGLTRRANGERPLSPDLVVVRVMMSVGFGATVRARATIARWPNRADSGRSRAAIVDSKPTLSEDNVRVPAQR
jgi:hypothetical protein